jgi:hypothetical protein
VRAQLFEGGDVDFFDVAEVRGARVASCMRWAILRRMPITGICSSSLRWA